LEKLKVEDFRLKIENECRRQRLPKPEIIEERLGSIKLRICLTIMLTSTYILMKTLKP
jgi:hypothetical protein